MTTESSDIKVVEFPDADTISMDKCVRAIIENMFDYDNDVGELEVLINKGKDNEAQVTLQLRITSINGTKLIEGDATNG